MEMSDYEICRAYREAKHKREQIKILAELNGTNTKKITEILVANGERGFTYPASQETMDRLERERLERMEKAEERQTEEGATAQEGEPMKESTEGTGTEKLLEREFALENPGCGGKKENEKKPKVPGTVLKLIGTWLEENKAAFEEAKGIVKAYEEAEDWFFGRNGE